MPDGVERDLLDRFVQGDEAAFEALFRLFEREVFGWILRVVRDRNAAEEVLVEAFWRAYRGRARFDASRSFGAWIRRIATNAAINRLAKIRRERNEVALSSDTLGTPPAPDDTFRESVERAFRTLPVKLRVVATLALIEEQPHAEIADALDLPVGTVKSRLHRATRSLREELARLGVRL
jgi:RNA polymerase sigma-70 factor (ECF subfamily)